MRIQFENWPQNMQISNDLTDYYRSLDPKYLINRIEEEMVKLPNYDLSNKDEPEQTDWTLGRLQSWYAGRELGNLGNAVSFEADRNLQQMYRQTTVNRLNFSPADGSYQHNNTLGFYNDNSKQSY